VAQFDSIEHGRNESKPHRLDPVRVKQADLIVPDGQHEDAPVGDAGQHHVPQVVVQERPIVQEALLPDWGDDKSLGLFDSLYLVGHGNGDLIRHGQVIRVPDIPGEESAGACHEPFRNAPVEKGTL